MSQAYSSGNRTLQHLAGITPAHLSMIQADQAAYRINRFEKDYNLIYALILLRFPAK